MSLAEINSRIVAASAETGSEATLIAISKVQPLERVINVLEQGHRVFGENRVQEAQGKWPQLKEKFPGVSLHLVGPLQTNKVRPALELFDVIQTVDRAKLARAIARIGKEIGREPGIFVQVNTGAENQKAGVLPDETDALVAECRDLGLRVLGLMCIPPVDEAPSLHFALLRKIAERNGLTQLSMGMSADFEEALSFGATHVRVGSAIFGARTPG